MDMDPLFSEWYGTVYPNPTPQSMAKSGNILKNVEAFIREKLPELLHHEFEFFSKKGK